MKPKAYAKKHGLTGYALGERLGVSKSLGCLLIKGTRRVSPILARQIERRSRGEITVNDLRPDVFGPPPRMPRKKKPTPPPVDELSTPCQPEQTAPAMQAAQPDQPQEPDHGTQA
jgi:hypothetical protein